MTYTNAFSVVCVSRGPPVRESAQERQKRIIKAIHNELKLFVVSVSLVYCPQRLGYAISFTRTFITVIDTTTTIEKCQQHFLHTMINKCWKRIIFAKILSESTKIQQIYATLKKKTKWILLAGGGRRNNVNVLYCNENTSFLCDTITVFVLKFYGGTKRIRELKMEEIENEWRIKWKSFQLQW